VGGADGVGHVSENAFDGGDRARRIADGNEPLLDPGGAAVGAAPSGGDRMFRWRAPGSPDLFLIVRVDGGEDEVGVGVEIGRLVSGDVADGGADVLQTRYRLQTVLQDDVA
jgi:hypothetical protein